jgi:hypothetical protein
MYLFLQWYYILKRMGANNRFSEGSPVGVIKISAVSMRPLDPILWFQWHRWIRVNDTFKSAESYKKNFIVEPVVSLRLRNPYFANDDLEYLGEFEAIFETALACESGT